MPPLLPGSARGEAGMTTNQLLGYIVGETDDSERRKFMLNVPPPARPAYKVIGRGQLAKETAQLRR